MYRRSFICGCFPGSYSETWPLNTQPWFSGIVVGRSLVEGTKPLTLLASWRLPCFDFIDLAFKSNSFKISPYSSLLHVSGFTTYRVSSLSELASDSEDMYCIFRADRTLLRFSVSHDCLALAAAVRKSNFCKVII